jgi:hypothetical protein
MSAVRVTLETATRRTGLLMRRSASPRDAAAAVAGEGQGMRSNGGEYLLLPRAGVMAAAYEH